jgi:hypothetical protein
MRKGDAVAQLFVLRFCISEIVGLSARFCFELWASALFLSPPAPQGEATGLALAALTAAGRATGIRAGQRFQPLDLSQA